MIAFRKLDFYGQTFLGLVMVLSIPFLLLCGFLSGLLVLGCWQLISASLNTLSFSRSRYKKKILIYWKLTVADLLVLLLCFPGAHLFNRHGIQVVVAIALGSSVVIAVYYLHIYQKLINHIEFKKELSGFLKS